MAEKSLDAPSSYWLRRDAQKKKEKLKENTCNNSSGSVLIKMALDENDIFASVVLLNQDYSSELS